MATSHPHVHKWEPVEGKRKRGQVFRCTNTNSCRIYGEDEGGDSGITARNCDYCKFRPATNFVAGGFWCSVHRFRAGATSV